MPVVGRYLESPPFRYEVPTGLAAGGSYSKAYEKAEDPEKKYLPFNLMTISNFSNQKIKVEIGDTITKTIFPSSELTIEVDAIYRWRITNVDSVATDDIVEVILEKRLTERELLKRIAKKMGVL